MLVALFFYGVHSLPPGRDKKTSLNGSRSEGIRPVAVTSKTCPNHRDAHKKQPTNSANQVTTSPPAIEFHSPHPRCAFSPQAPTLRACPNPRSEERRVGKECRS